MALGYWADRYLNSNSFRNGWRAKRFEMRTGEELMEDFNQYVDRAEQVSYEIGRQFAIFCADVADWPKKKSDLQPLGDRFEKLVNQRVIRASI